MSRVCSFWAHSNRDQCDHRPLLSQSGDIIVFVLGMVTSFVLVLFLRFVF